MIVDFYIDISLYCCGFHLIISLMFYFVFVQQVFSQKTVEMLAEGFGSTLETEALAFVSENCPQFYIEYKKFIDNNKFNSREELISQSEAIIQQPFLSLLDFSLRSNLYKPKASTMFNISETSRQAKGWGVFTTPQDIQYDSSNFHFKFLSAFSKFTDSLEQLSFFKDMLNKMTDYLPVISQMEVDLNAESNYKHKTPPSNPFILVNGQQTKHDYYSISRAVVDEVKIHDALVTKLHLPPSVFRNISTGHNFFEVNHYIEPPRKENGCHLVNPSEKYHEKPKPKSFDFTSKSTFLDTPTNKLKVNIIFDLSSPEALALMDYAFDVEKNDKSIDLTVFPIANDEKEEEIMLGFYYIKNSCSMRGSLLYLFTGMQDGNYKKAYKEAFPNIKWEKLHDNQFYENDMKQIKEMQEYKARHNLSHAEIQINGHFIEDVPKFLSAASQIDIEVERLMELGKFNLIDVDTNWDQYFINNSLHIETTQPPIRLTISDAIDISDASSNDLAETANEIFENIVHQNANDKTFVVLVGYEEQINEQATVSFIKNPSKTFLKTTKLTSKTATIVGPYCFNRRLSQYEIEYAVEYVHLAYSAVIPLMDIKQKIVTTFWRGNDRRRGIERFHCPDSFAIIKHDPNNPIQICINMDPFSDDMPMALDAVNEVAASKVAGVSIYPIIQEYDGQYYPPVARNFIYPDENGIVSYEGEISLIEYPRTTWGVEKTNENVFTIKNIFNDGYAVNSDYVVANRIYKPLGYEHWVPIVGLVSVYDDFVVDSWVPLQKTIIGHQGIPNIKFDNSPHIVTSNIPIYTKFKECFNSLIGNKDLVVHVLSNEPVDKIKKGKLEILPLFTHPTIRCDVTTDIIWNYFKLVYASVLSYNSKLVLVSDGSVMWKRDPTSFVNLDMKGCIIAAPKFSDSAKAQKGKYWMETKNINKRLGRPFLNPSTVIIDNEMFNWKSDSSNIFFNQCLKKFTTMEISDNGEDLINDLQTSIQMMTLDPNIGVVKEHCTQQEFKDSISYVVNDEENNYDSEL